MKIELDRQDVLDLCSILVQFEAIGESMFREHQPATNLAKALGRKVLHQACKYERITDMDFINNSAKLHMRDIGL